MEEQVSLFTHLPSEVLVDLLLFTDAKSVSQFYAVNTTHKQLFTQQNGLWQLLTCKICHWSAAGNFSINLENQIYFKIAHLLMVKIARFADAQFLPDVKLFLDRVQKDSKEAKNMDWHKEYRVVSYFNSKIRNAELTHNNIKPRPSKLQVVAKNHFKVESCAPEDFGVDYSYCALQAVEPLYPLPIGNFTVAYYEVEVFKVGEFDLVIGAGQDGYVGYVGLGRCSFSFGSDPTSGIFYLGSEFVSEESQTNPLYFLHIGDKIGFGIDFSKKSVFWTKNGQFLYESTVDARNSPILNIKTLHATVSMDNHEFKANFGTEPFSFDVLAYQKKNSNTGSCLYSQIIVPHLCAYQDSESLAEHENNHNINAFHLLASDLTPPKFKTDIAPLMYMETYTRNDPRIGEKYTSDFFIQLQTCRAVCAWSQHLQEMKEPVQRSTQRFLQSLADMFSVPNYEEKSWPDKVESIARRADEHVLNLMSELANDTIATTVDEAYTRLMPDWAVIVTAFHQLIFVEQPLDHFVKEAAIAVLHDQAENDQLTIQDLVSFTFSTMLRYRSATMQTVAKERCAVILDKKLKEFDELQVIYGADYDLFVDFMTLFSELKSHASAVLPRTDLDKRLEPLYMLGYSGNLNGQGVKSKPLKGYFVLYGIYKLKISHRLCVTEEEYLAEVKKTLLLTLKDEELAKEFLQYCKDRAKNDLNDESFRLAVTPLFLYGFEPDVIQGPVPKLRETVLAIPAMERLLAPKVKLNKPKIALGIGLVAAISFGLGYYLFRKKFK